MRRIVTESLSGCSRVLSDEEAGAAWPGVLWGTSLASPLGPLAGGLGEGPGREEGGLPHLERGETSWRLVHLPPDTEMQKLLAAGSEGHDAEGFHQTATIDYIVVLDDGITLMLDDAEVALRRGDLVIQRATRHAWRNGNNDPARLLCVMAGA